MVFVLLYLVVQIQKKGFGITPVACVGDSISWQVNRLYAEDALKGLNHPGPAEGKVLPVIVALDRKVGDKEQRILVAGDADCISNGELGANREFRRSNYALTDGMFRWLVYDEYPIDVSRPAAKDNDTYLTPGGFAWIKIFLRWICPVLIVVCGCVIWVMRRMK